jgi:hypothetical protein
LKFVLNKVQNFLKTRTYNDARRPSLSDVDSPHHHVNEDSWEWFAPATGEWDKSIRHQHGHEVYIPLNQSHELEIPNIEIIPSTLRIWTSVYSAVTRIFSLERNYDAKQMELHPMTAGVTSDIRCGTSIVKT